MRLYIRWYEQLAALPRRAWESPLLSLSTNMPDWPTQSLSSDFFLLECHPYQDPEAAVIHLSIALSLNLFVAAPGLQARKRQTAA